MSSTAQNKQFNLIPMVIAFVLVFILNGETSASLFITFWPTTEGRIINLRHYKNLFGKNCATVTYEYQEKGVHYTNNGIEPHDTNRGGFLGLFGLFDMDSSEYGSPEIDEKYPVGSKVLVHYDCSNPKRACLELHFLPFHAHP